MVAILWLNPNETLASQTKITWLPVPKYVTNNGQTQITLRARAHWDIGWLNSEFGNGNLKGNEIRTARIGFDAKFGSKVSARGELAFSGNTLNVNEVKVIVGGPLKFIVGQQKIGPSISEVTSGNNEPFMERGHFTDAFFVDRGLGLGFFTNGERWSLTGGILKGSLQNGFKNEYLTLTTRATISPKINNGILHFGGSIRYRDKTEDEENFSYRQRAHFHYVKTRFIDTGKIGTSDLMFVAEFSYNYNALTFQTEVAQLTAKLGAPQARFGNPTFKSSYIGFDWYITGETRPYNPGFGNYGAIIPKSSVNEGGYGAWQVAARLDYVDLSDEGILGGEQSSYLFGVNWHLNRWFRVMLNYTHSIVKEGQFVTHNGAKGQNKVSGFGMRFQFNY